MRIDREREAKGRALVLEALERLVPGREGLRDATADDLALATGLKPGELSRILPPLAVEYGARVAATRAGELLWRFPGRLLPRRLPPRPDAARGGGLGGRLRMGARRAAVLVARGILGVGWSVWAFLAFLLFSRETWNPPVKRGRRLGFYQTLFSFAIGGAPDPDAARASREEADFLAWTATRGGLVSAAEHALRQGLCLPAAEERMAAFAAVYGGEPLALGEGVLAWDFPLARNPRHPRRPEAPFRLMLPFSENLPRLDRRVLLLGLIQVIAGAAFMAMGAAWSLTAGRPPFALDLLVRFFGYLEPPVSFWILGVLPASTGAMGLLMAAARAIRVAAVNRRRRRENDRMNAGRLLLANGGMVELDPDARDPRLPRDADKRRFVKALDALFADFTAAGLGGEITGTESGRIAWRFERLARELALLRDARAERARAVHVPGEGDEVVFDSGETQPRPGTDHA